MFRRFIFFLLVILFIFTCSKQGYTEKDISKIVQRTDSLLINLEGQKYDWASAKAYSTVLAYYPEPDIIFLNESLTYRKAAEAFNLYYYKDGHLVHFIGKKLEYFSKKVKKENKLMTNLTLNLDFDGDVISYQKIVNGKLLNLEDTELDEILSHSKELNKLVGDKEE